MSKTVKDIEKEGGKCEKVATDFWECKDKDDKVWWCSDKGNACVEKPKVSMSIKGLEKEGAECKQMDKDLWICHHPDGKVWSCQGRKEDSSCIIIKNPDEKKPDRSIIIRETQDCKAVEVICEKTVTVKDIELEYRFNFTYEAGGTFKSGFVELGTGDNHIFTRKIQSDNSGYINSVTKFGPRVKGGAILATSAIGASKNSVIVTGSIDDVPILPIAFVNKLPGKSCLECGEDVIHSPLMTINKKEPSPVIIDQEMLPAIEKLMLLVRSDLSIAGHSAGSVLAPPGLWPGKGFWCIAACATAATACVVGTSGTATWLCLIAQAACEAACIS